MSKLASRIPATPAICGEVVVVMPPDAPGLLALDLRTGSILWRDVLKEFQCLCGACGEDVLAAGDTIASIDAQNGRLRWEIPLLKEKLYGAPVLDHSTLWVPTDRRLIALDAVTGKEKSSSEWGAAGPFGNLSIVGGELFGASRTQAARFKLK